MKMFLWLATAVSMASCTLVCSLALCTASHAKEHPQDAIAAHPDTYDALIAKHAKRHGVPEALVHRIIVRESRYCPTAMNRIYFGLMQITYATARSMGYKGTPKGLLDAETNLTYAVPYLANAYLVAGKNDDRAVSLYSAGYYFEARRQHKLDSLRTALSEPLTPPPPVVAEAPQPAPNPVAMLFHALTGDPAPAPTDTPTAVAETSAPATTTPAAADKAPAAETTASAEAKPTPSTKKKTTAKKMIATEKTVVAKTAAASDLKPATKTAALHATSVPNVK